MQRNSTVLFFILSLIAWGTFSTATKAQTNVVTEVALKSGESVDISDLYWTVNCKTFLKGLPEVEILDGPPGVTAVVKEKMVLPRGSQCAKRIPGGTLSLKAGDIGDDSTSVMVLRIKFQTLEGRRDRNWNIRVTLIAS